MEEEELEKLRKAGKIAAEALKYAKSLIKPGASLLDVTKKVEEKIVQMGGGFAFPAQFSCNDIAAHYCAEADDDIIFDKQLVSVDIGVEVDGFIGDNAMTVDLSGENSELVQASRDALENALKLIKPGAKLGEIGKAIQDAITSRGFAPVRNLSGHGLGEYKIHTKPTIPNYDNGDETELKEGDVIAIEPFASAGAGVVYESSPASVFELIEKKPVRNMFTRKILKEIEGYKDLPFCRRWLVDKFGEAKVNFALRELKNIGVIREYPPLVDQSHGLVSQAEKSLIVTEDGCEVLTDY
ncbi:type II methionyl aminopeptidase [Candidatus Woesearchaeota archaeon]|nr:type II methionyl aminopeptidase [Candidatus Woesearchaeota archaeon]